MKRIVMLSVVLHRCKPVELLWSGGVLDEAAGLLPQAGLAPLSAAAAEFIEAGLAYRRRRARTRLAAVGLALLLLAGHSPSPSTAGSLKPTRIRC
jgi:hypothetical protein